ncbi:MAG: tetratricopeptide repeat protein, partial [Pseudomonadota bacterium]
RHHWHQRTAESLNRSVELFEQAIAADPQYAPAYTGLADAYLLLVGYGDMDPKVAQRKAEPLIATALSLGPDLAEPYASQGLLRWIRGDHAAAELALRAAVERNPNYSMASMWLGGVLGEEHRYTESLAAYQNAWAADPLHPVINSNLAGTYLKMGRFTEAREAVRRMTSLGYEAASASLLAAEVESQAGNLVGAVEIATAAAELHPDNPKLAMLTSSLYAMLGREEAARGWLGKAEVAGVDGPHLRLMHYLLLLRLGEGQRIADLSEAMLAEVPEWHLGGLDDTQRALLVWPGITRLVDGRLEEGLEILGYADVQSGIMGLSTESQVGILSLMAHAEMQLNLPPARIATRLERAATVAREAQANGWNSPGMQVRLAVVEAMRGNVNEAAALLNEAVDAGWHDLYLELSLPGAQVLEGPEFRAILNRVEQDLAAMRRQLVDA